MVGRIIRFMRLKSGYKQEEIAELLGLKQNSFSDYERGYSAPSFETVARIAEICDFEITFIDINSGERITKESFDKTEDTLLTMV